MEFLLPGKTPDLAIDIDDIRISWEVKRITDKLKDLPWGEVHIINDITTVMTAFKKSVEKDQYLRGKPHIIYFDCPSLSEGEIIDIFYPIKGQDTSITWEINHKFVHPSNVYNGYFQERNPNTGYTYSIVSGVACKFFTGQIIPQISDIVFFRILMQR